MLKVKAVSDRPLWLAAYAKSRLLCSTETVALSGDVGQKPRLRIGSWNVHTLNLRGDLFAQGQCSSVNIGNCHYSC